MQRRIATTTAVVLAAACSAPLQAADLADFILDLYGGDGIRLPPAPDIPDFIADAHVPHFTGEQQIQELNALSKGLLAGTSQYAINSTVTGVSFDLSQGVPIAVEDSLGPLLTERASTIGRGRLNFGFSYSNNDYSELDGDDLSDLTLDLTHQDCCAVGPPPIPPPDGQITGFERDTITLNIDIDLEQEVYAFFASYGLTENWDLGVVVPVVSVDATATSVATINITDENSEIEGEPVHSFEADPARAVSRTGGDETGLGDVIVRTKYSFLRQDSDSFMDFAVLGQVILATGDEDKLLGTGETRYKAMLIGSKRMGNFTPHVNLAYEASTGPDELDNYSYALGLDGRISDRVSASAAVLGRYNPDLEEIGNHTIDGALALKWNPWSNTNAPLHAFVTVPLNDDGLRADFVWGLGFDLIFN